MPGSLATIDLASRAAVGRLAQGLRRAGVPGVALLESGLGLNGLGTRSYLCARPLAVASARPGQPLRLLSGPSAWGEGLDPDPLRAAQELLERAAQQQSERSGPSAEPFAGGAVLSLAYDLGRRYEAIPERHPPAPDAPADLHVAVYGRVLCFDHAGSEVRWLGSGPGLDEADLAAARRAVVASFATEDLAPAFGAAPAEEPAHGEESLDASAYREAVEQAIDAIRRGDLFEVNLSRRHRLAAPDLERVADALRREAPAAYMADLCLGEPGRERRLLSASPERFLRLDASGHVSSWPIKGTRARGATPEQDQRLARELVESEKDAAELAMIVDLVRNDLGRVATPGSVRVREPRLLQSWPAVHHTVAIVEAQLAPEHDWVDLVRAAFPPGSVTGAPKVAAMELIEALEPTRRGLYCGAFGWVGFDGALDLAVAIRVLDATAERIDVHAGGAVLLDSDPVAEEQEARAKARALLRAVAAGADSAGAVGGEVRCG